MQITVNYWVGTRQYEGKATTYAGAMRLAQRTQNAADPTYYDESGRQLHDDGNGLAYLDDNGNPVYCVMSRAAR